MPIGRIQQKQAQGRIQSLEEDVKSISTPYQPEKPSWLSSIGSLIKTTITAPFTKQGREDIKTGFIEKTPGTVAGIQESAGRILRQVSPKVFGTNILPTSIQSKIYDQVGKTLQDKSTENRKLQLILDKNYGMKLTGKESVKELISNPEYVRKYLIGGNLPSLIVAGIGGVATAPLGGVGAFAGAGATAGLLEGGFAINEAKNFLENSEDPRLQKLATDDKFLNRVGITTGVINAMLEATPFGIALKKSPIGSVVKDKILNTAFKRIMGKITATTIAEGTTESLQEIVSNSVKQTYDENQELINKDVALAGIGGGILGGGLGTAGVGMDVVRSEAERLAKMTPEEKQRGFIKLYHGTDEQFDEFNLSKSKITSNYGQGIYFSDNKKLAEYYSTIKTKSSDLSKADIEDLANLKTRIGDIKEIDLSEDAKIKVLPENPTKEMIQKAKDEGFDGVKFKDTIAKEDWDFEVLGEVPKDGNTTIIFNEDVLKQPKKKEEPPHIQKLKQDIEYNKLVKGMVEDRVENSVGGQLKKFMSKKEGEFLDFKNATKEPDPVKRQKIEERNKKIEIIMQDSVTESESYNMNDPDVIRQIIEDYDKDKQTINELKQSIKDKKEILILEQIGIKLAQERQKLIDFQQKYPELASFIAPLPKEMEKVAIKGYKLGEKVGAKVMRKAVTERLKGLYDQRVSKIKSAKDILKARREMIRAVQMQFGLGDKDLKTITQRDIRLMSNLEFKEYLDKIREKSEQLAKWIAQRDLLIAQINEKNLDIEPLRKAMKLKKIPNMSLADLKLFDETLEPYNKGDVFLSQRKLETIQNTELAGIKTYREAREILAKKLGVTPEELNNLKISEFDKFRGHTGLAEKDPFFKMMVEETAKARLVREAEYLDIEKRITELAEKRNVKFIDKLIPQQQNIVDWFNAEDKSKIELSEPEQQLVTLMQEEWIKARDYLIKIQAMNKGRKSDNYFTHIRRGILETIREDGIIQAVKEVFSQYKEDEKNFGILDSKTGEVLALQKFFQYAMARSDKLEPSKNVIKAFLTYMRTFKKKQALDEIVPLIDVYAHSLTPKETTKTGIPIRGDMITFTKEWLNTQKGRYKTLAVKQGGVADTALRVVNSFLSLLDIGLSLPVSVATQVGEQAVQFQVLGNKAFVKSKYRALTPKGRRIRQKYENFIGSNPWSKLIEPARSLGDRLMEGIFVLFRDANIRRNRNILLGLMTDEEFKNETISPERLAQVKVEAGRYAMVDGFESIIGATPEAGILKKYKSWAIPIMATMGRNFYSLSKMLSKDTAKKSESRRAVQEILRMAEMGLVVVTVGLFVADQEDDQSLIGKLKKRMYQEALTLYSAINPVTFLSTPRLWSFAYDFASNLMSIIKLEQYETSKFGEYEAGELKGLNKLKKQLTPRAIRQFDKVPEKDIEDIKAETKAKLESGELDMSGAKTFFQNELDKLETAQRAKTFALPFEDYKVNLRTRLQEKKIDVEDAKLEFMDYIEKNEIEMGEVDEETFIDRVKLYATAMKVDMPTAFATIFHNNRIRKIENGTIIVERNATLFNKAEDIPLNEKRSQKIRKELGAGKDLILDHTIPLGLGGLDERDNVKLIPVDEWESNTPVEVYLIKKLYAGLITKEEARKLILDFKNGKLSAVEIMP
jgi:hypothetical protein